MKADISDFLIVGGGVIGLLMARELAQAGATVTLADKGKCGTEASWAGGGIVSPLYPWRYRPEITALAKEAQRCYPELVEALFDESGIDPELECTGLLMLEADDAVEALAWSQRNGSKMSAINAEAIYAREPLLASGFRQGLWMPEIANVRNPQLLKALIVSARSCPNIRIIENAAVERFEVAKSGSLSSLTCAHIRCGGELSSVRAGQFVVTAGAWSAQLLKPLEVDLAIEPVKGQMLLFNPPRRLLQTMVLTKGRYLIPRRDKHLLVGSTLEYSEFDKSTSETALQSLRQSAIELLPELAGHPVIKQWAGLRPGAPNGIPYIGRIDAYVNLSVNAGQFRNGLVLAPASARLLADILLGRETALDANPYKP